MRRAVHAEWTKLRTVPSTAWLVLAAVAFTVALSALVSVATSTEHCPSPAECFEDTTEVSLFGVRLGQVAIVVLAVLAVTNEYGTRMIQTTFAATPRRLTVLATKGIVVTAAALAAGAVAVAASLLAGRSILPGNGYTPANGYPPLSLADEATRRAAIGTVLYLGLIALLSLGVGTIVRDTAGAITVVLGLLFLFPMLAMLVDDPRWHARLEKYAPMTAGLYVQATRGLDDLPLSPWHGLGVLAAYAGAALLVGAVLFTVRDA
ncbi:MAG TPA: ABC transporter permease [Pilimelia sp.]|nr:ABC transporter permease [Pilimelia sp.]